MELILIVKAVARTPMTVPRGCEGSPFPLVFLCRLCAWVYPYIHCTVYCNYTHYSSWSLSMIIQESCACQNGHNKLTRACQCENTISSAFTLLQSNNPLLIQNLNKFRKLAGGGARVPPGEGGKICLTLPRRWLRFCNQQLSYISLMLKR